MFEKLGAVFTHSGSKRKTKHSQARKKHVSQPLEFKMTRRQVMLTLALLGLLIMFVALPRTQWLPIEKIRIAGDFRHLDRQQLRSQLEPFLGQGFFLVDIKRIQQMVGAQSWIRDVSVRRVWPNQIRVSIIEKQAYARWDSNHLLSTRGRVFKADADAFGHLPLINGYAGRSLELLQAFASIQQRLGQASIRITGLHEDAKGALSLQLDDQIKVILGSDDSDYKISQLLKIYPLQVRPRVGRIAHIDFRYANGFAIGWKPGMEQEVAPQQVGRTENGVIVNV
jgi:cell division protein FtsQ